MKFRNTVILLVVLAALGVYVLVVEVKRPAPVEGTPTPTTEPQPVILSYNPADIAAVRLAQASTGKRTELAYKDDGRWYLTAPVAEEANQDQVISLVDSLSALRAQRVLTATTSQAADYGLNPPALTAEIVEKGGAVHTLDVGVQTTSGSAYYGQVAGDQRVYLIGLSVGSDLERYLNTPPVPPTPTATAQATIPPVLPPPPTATGTPGS